MDQKSQMYQLLKKQNSKMIFKAILYYVFTPLLIPVSIFCLTYIGHVIKLIARNWKAATNIFKNSITPKAYKPLVSYQGEYDDVEKYFTEKGKGVHITNNFLIIKTKNSFDILPKTSIVWLYYSMEKDSLVTKYGHSNIQTTVDNSLVLHTNIGNKYKIRLFQSTEGISSKVFFLNEGASVNDVLKSLPNAVWGYSQALEKMYKSNPKTFYEKNV